MIVFLISVLKIVILLGFLVFIHELGHFLIAKWCKVKVKEFAIGFGPVLFSKQGKETKYQIRAIPLGGFVSMEGEEERSEEEGAFNKVSIPKRIAIVSAGGLVNIIFALIVYMGLQTATPNNVTTTVDSCTSGYSAESVGIMPGDTIKKINGKSVKKTLEDIREECPNIDITKVIEETGVESNYSFGAKKGAAILAVQGKGTYAITEEEKQKLVELGVISLEKEESAMSKFVRVCEALAKQEFDFENFKYSKKITENGKKKQVTKTLEDIGQEYPNIDIIKVIEETGVESNYSLGAKKGGAILAVQGKGSYAITEEEKQKLVALGVIDLEEIERRQRLTQAKKQRDAAKVQNDKAQELEQQVEQALDQQKKRGKKDEGR